MTRMNTSVPRAPIHIHTGSDEFTDADIREWARGNLENIDWAADQGALLIECLSQIIVSRVLGSSGGNPMRTLRDTLLAAVAALASVPQSDHIKVWPFRDAPAALQGLSQAGGDEDWLAVVPDEMLALYFCVPWLGRSAGICRVREYPIAGATVFIGQHA